MELWSYGAVYFYTTFIRAITSLPQIRQVGAMELELESFYCYTTFIRAMTSLLQIRQVALLRSTTCNLQGLSPTQRSTQTTPSRNRTLGVMQVPWLELESTNPLQISRGEDRLIWTVIN